MLTSINLGDRVKIEPGNRWDDYGDNPDSTANGTIVAVESGWVLVEWDGLPGQFNYRPFDLVPGV